MPNLTPTHQDTPAVSYVLPSALYCTYCGAKKFITESQNFCCSKGEVNLYPNVIPDRLEELYSGGSAESLHFRQFIRPYNDAFAFTSFRVNLDPEFAKRLDGIFTFRAQGQVYHYINSLFPDDEAPSFLQLYFYDTQREVDHRIGDKDELQPTIIEDLIAILRGNPYSRFFRSLTDIPDIHKCQIRLKTDPEIQEQNAGPPIVSQVAAIWYENEKATELTVREISSST